MSNMYKVKIGRKKIEETLIKAASENLLIGMEFLKILTAVFKSVHRFQ